MRSIKEEQNRKRLAERKFIVKPLRHMKNRFLSKKKTEPVYTFDVREEHLSDLYIYSKVSIFWTKINLRFWKRILQQQTTLKQTDEICLSTSWPWILQPESTFIMIWDTVLVFIILIVAVLYPYQICFVRKFTEASNVVMFLVDVMYIFDIILQIFTAVETDTGLVYLIFRVTKTKNVFSFRYTIERVEYNFD